MRSTLQPSLLSPVAMVALAAFALGGCKKNESAPASASSGASSSEAQTEGHAALKSLTDDEVDQRLAANDGKFQVFDANEKETFQANHLPGAKWVPFNAVTAEMLPKDKSTTLVFYCANEH